MIIDTHVLIWLFKEPTKVSKVILNRLENPDQELFLSQFAFIEVAIKKRIGKLDVTLSDLGNEAKRTGINVLYITDSQLQTYVSLTQVKHKDPFDVAHIAVAIAEHKPLITADAKVLKLQIPGLELIDARK